MAAALALISAVLLSQIATSMAATSPFTVSLPCSSYTNGCTCDAVGLADNSTAANVVYTSDRDGTCCQFVTPTKNCREWLDSDATGCGTDGTKLIDLSALKTAAGTSPSTTCCKDAPSVTCADVTCTARRRSAAAMWKAKANVATTACTSDDDCENKCCEKDTTTCYYGDESSGSNGSTGYSCGSGKVKKDMESTTCSGGTHSHSLTSTASMQVSNEAGYQSTCCKASSSCPSSPSCPSNMVKDNGTTTYWQSETECCTYADTACVSGWNGTFFGCTGDYSSQGGDSCGVGATTVCISSLCNANEVLDTTKVFATGDNDAAKKTKCCIAKVTASGTTCSSWAAAAKAEATKTASTADAPVNSASLAVLVFGAFVVKFGL